MYSISDKLHVALCAGGAKKSPLLLVGILGLLGAGVAVLVGSKKKA